MNQTGNVSTDWRSVGERVDAVRSAIAALAPDPSVVRLVAVTKGFDSSAVEAAVAAGVVDVGENYGNELVVKFGQVQSPALGLRWHFLGSVQRNKVARLAPLVTCWQAVSRKEEGRAIATRRPGASVLVQVDTAARPDRGGVAPEAVPDLVRCLRDEALSVDGLMTVGVPGPPETVRDGFRRVAVLADQLDLPIRSMGMSGDFRIALAEGSTMIRIGQGLFGPRVQPGGVPGGVSGGRPGGQPAT